MLRKRAQSDSLGQSHERNVALQKQRKHFFKDIESQVPVKLVDGVGSAVLLAKASRMSGCRLRQSKKASGTNLRYSWKTMILTTVDNSLPLSCGLDDVPIPPSSDDGAEIKRDCTPGKQKEAGRRRPRVSTKRRCVTGMPAAPTAGAPGQSVVEVQEPGTLAFAQLTCQTV